MPESDVRFVFGRILHRYKSDGPFSDEDEGKAEIHSLHQRVGLPHGCHSMHAVDRCRPPNFDLAM